MKIHLLLWVVVPLLAGMAACASYSDTWLGLPGNWVGAGPALECPRLLELGERELGEVALVRFMIANHGGEALIIDEVRSNCSCSGLEQEQAGEFVRLGSLRIGPGKAARVAMRVLVQGSPGSPMITRVEFRSNDPKQPLHAIEAVVAKVTAGVTTRPTSAIFGNVTTDGELRKVLDVFDAAIQPRAIARVASLDPDRVTVRALSTESGPGAPTNDPLGTWIGRVEVTAQTKTAGPLESEIEIHLTGEHRPPTRIPVRGRIVAPVEVSPSIIVLPRTSEAGPIYSANCVCTSTSGKAIAVTVDSLPKGLAAEVEETRDDPAQQTVRVEWNPTAESDAKPTSQRTVSLRAVVDDRATKLEIRVLCLPKGGD